MTLATMFHSAEDWDQALKYSRKGFDYIRDRKALYLVKNVKLENVKAHYATLIADSCWSLGEFEVCRTFLLEALVYFMSHRDEEHSKRMLFPSFDLLLLVVKKLSNNNLEDDVRICECFMSELIDSQITSSKTLKLMNEKLEMLKSYHSWREALELLVAVCQRLCSSPYPIDFELVDLFRRVDQPLNMDDLRKSLPFLRNIKVCDENLGRNVFKGYDFGSPVAVKKIPKKEGLYLKGEEAVLQYSLNHQCICRLYGIHEDKNDLMLVMEYCERGSLLNLQPPEIKSHRMRILKGIVSGMVYLHAQSPAIYHGDLKLENILITSNYGAKIADFGISRRMHNELTCVRGQTEQYAAPEVRHTQEASLKSDVFSFAFILAVLIGGENPANTFENNINWRPSLNLEKCPDLTKEAIHLIEACWNVCPEERPTFPKIQEIIESWNL
eukprot:TRINITY_DN60182_c0_g1_i2.p1 TRINITY_DN60182_c0_g1~~TRINITY_DN60182_c0_g1_i2.p1  ORF type:complete len:441 (-),score=97.67 TRINITY_DN60182_c0_g1_i2:65-1387(-)